MLLQDWPVQVNQPASAVDGIALAAVSETLFDWATGLSRYVVINTFLMHLVMPLSPRSFENSFSVRLHCKAHTCIV